MLRLLPVAALLAVLGSACVVETTTGCPSGCPAGTTCGTDGLCHAATTCPGGCPAGTTCGADGLCHATTGAAPTYGSCTSAGGCAVATNTCATVTTPSTTGGNFCTLAGCTSSAQCAAGPTGLSGACLMIASGGGYACFPGCNTNADCLTGTSCIAVMGGAVGSVCMPGAPISTGAPAYSQCTPGTSNACAAPNLCVTVSTPSTTGGSFCSFGCSHSSDCVPGPTGLASACLMLAAGGPYECYPGCNTNADCLTGSSCTPVTGGATGSVCMPGAPITLLQDYDHCTLSSDCASGLCATVQYMTTDGINHTGNQCTEPCGSSATCPDRSIAHYGAACLMLAGTASAFYCYQGCASDADCPGSGLCTPVIGGASGSACFPNG